MNKLKKYIFLFFVVLIFSSSKSMAQDCNYWYESVGVESIQNSQIKIDEKDPAQIFNAVECLLKLEGNKSRGAFSGATNNRVSQLLPKSTVEICALYYISYLFYEKYDHADGVALFDHKSRKLNTEKAIEMAYDSYRKWFEKVKEIGLLEARKQKLDPLEGSGVSWY